MLRVDGVSGASYVGDGLRLGVRSGVAGRDGRRVEIYGGAPREAQGGTLLGEVRADQALSSPLAREVSAACDGPNRTYARHGFSFTLPANHTGNVFVYAIDEATADGPAAPPTLIRNGIVHVPTCAPQRTRGGRGAGRGVQRLRRHRLRRRHARRLLHRATGPTTCAAAADTCAPAQQLRARQQPSVRRRSPPGWIEAPVDGNYMFESSLQPSRLFVNGTKVLDWFEARRARPGERSRWSRRQKYHLRWDRFQAEPPGGLGAGSDLAAARRGRAGADPAGAPLRAGSRRRERA